MSNNEAPFKYLTSGIDTLEVSFYLRQHMSENRFLDFTTLAAMKEEIRAQKSRKLGKIVQFGNQEFLLRGHGTNTGFPFFMENEHFQIGFGEFNKPNFSVKFSCEDLWHKGWKAAVEAFIDLVLSAGYAPYQPESVSRVDIAFDYLIPHVDFDEDSFHTLAINDGRIRKHRKTQTMRFGTDDVVLRVYNKSDEITEKSGKTWFYPIWGYVTENVWRFEWQFRGERLKQIGIYTLADLAERQGDLLRNHATAHTSLRNKSGGLEVKDCPVHPLWQDYLNRIAELPAIGVVREYKPEEVSEKRILRCLISVMGYLKRIAALDCLLRGKEAISFEDALNYMDTRLLGISDAASWHYDVQSRIREMRFHHE